MRTTLLRCACLSFCFVVVWINPLQAQTRSETALSYVELGNELARHEDFDRAIGAYNIALQFEPKLALAYFKRALAQQARGKFAEAIADYTKTLEIVPISAEAYANRANILVLQGQVDKALA